MTVQCPDLDVTKVADGPEVSAGDTIGFTITVSNAGPGTASGVTISDPLPTGSGISWSIDAGGSDAGCTVVADVLDCSFGSLAPAASRTVHVTSSTVAASCAAYPNTATADATNHPEVTAQASIDVECADIEILKTADADTVSAGDPIGFTIAVTNIGAASPVT